MSKPHFSAICVTYGRREHLERSIACFLRQKYDGQKQLLVLNTFNGQKFSCAAPEVKIINCDKRPANLGEARNLAISKCDGTHLVVWDDDDLFAENHLENFAKGFSSGSNWVWLDKQFYCEKFVIQKTVSGQQPCFAFTKAAWQKLGGYANLSVGEDRQFTGRLTAEFPGETVELKDNEISFCYSWDNGAFHVSGEGVDRPGLVPAHQRIEHDLHRRIRGGLERVGNIRLTPQLKTTPEEMIRRFFERGIPLHDSKPDLCLVELGRYGDVANILPICKHIAENYAKPHVMVSREFASILEGVSYVVPEIVDLPYQQLSAALKLAKERFKNVLRGQIYGLENGKPMIQEKKCASFNRESWRTLGFLGKFDDKSFKLVFDLRNPAREDALWRSVKKTDKPALLVQVTNSASSPFPHGKYLRAHLFERFGDKFEIIDLSNVTADRIYDLVGLLDRAAGLIAIDTALLHIAAASEVPVIALVNPMGWGGSELRCNCVARMTYTDVEENTEKLIEAIVRNIPCESPKAVEIHPEKIKPALKRRIWHAVERHDETNTLNTARKHEAQASWDDLYATGKVLPAHYWKYKRDARSIGSVRPLPFLKDLLSHAMEHADDRDIIFVTNDDIFLHPDLPKLLEFYVSLYGAACSRRCEFKTKLRLASPEETAKRCEHHLGRDLFAFTKEWLLKHWDDLPDFILGASDFDLCIAAMIRLEHGIKTDRRNIAENFLPAELPMGYISHQAHKGAWTDPKIENFDASQVWNRKLWREWAAKHLPDLKFTEQNTI